MPCGHSPPTACTHTVSVTISLPSQGFFSPFPHGTCSLSVASEYLALPDGPGRFSAGFLVSRDTQEPRKEDCIFAYRAITFYGRPFQTVRLTLSYPFLLLPRHSLSQTVEGVIVVLQPQALLSNHLGLGSSDFARHYYRNLC